MSRKMIYTIDGMSGSLGTLCSLFRVSETCVRSRMSKGMTLEQALKEPVVIGGRREKRVKEEPVKDKEPEIVKRKPVFHRTGASGGYYE